MAKLTDRLRGTVRAEISGVFPETVLNACALKGIELWHLECPDAYTVRLTVYEKQLEELRAAAEKSMCSLSVLSLRGGSRSRVFLRRRIWLLLSAALAAGLLALSSLFIWEIDIQGSEKLSRGQVLRALEDCGVGQGTYWPGLSADLVRSRMLTRLPELAWMTVNVSGSRAMVLLAERQEKPEIYQESQACDIRAGKTGILSRLSVLNGKPVVTEGQSVLEGELLVSGVMDSITNEPRLVRSRAEAMADTWTERTSVCPLEAQKKTEARRSFSRFALRLGKRRINFYFGGGKRLDAYDKIVYEYNLGIDGLFALPVTLVREKLTLWKTEAAACDSARDMERRLYAALEDEIDGEIVSASFSDAKADGLQLVTLRARCYENIATDAELTGEDGRPR